MNTTTEGPMAPQKSWWGRNWPWVIPVGCLGLLLSCGCLGALFAGLALKSFSDTPVFTESVARAKQSPEVREALGEPIETSWLGQQMNIKTHNDEGPAQLTIPLKGPRGEGMLRVKATKTEGNWRFQTLRVDVPDRAPINLLDTPSAEPPEPEPPSARPDLPQVEPLPEEDDEPPTPPGHEDEERGKEIDL